MFQKSDRISFISIDLVPQQNQLAFLIKPDNLGRDGRVFGPLSFIYLVRMIGSGNRQMCRNGNYVQFINLFKFFSFGGCSSSHTRQLFVHSKIILEGNCCQRPGFLLDLNALFGFNRLVQTIGITPSEHQYVAVCSSTIIT